VHELLLLQATAGGANHVGNGVDSRGTRAHCRSHKKAAIAERHKGRSFTSCNLNKKNKKLDNRSKLGSFFFSVLI
jgi:hypothetical protein